MKQIEMGPIETHEELVAWLRTEIAAGHVDIDVPIRHLRILWDIVDALTDADVEAAITEAFRSIEGPNVVLTLCNGTGVAEAGIHGDTTVDDAIYDLECACRERIPAMSHSPRRSPTRRGTASSSTGCRHATTNRTGPATYRS